MSFSATQNAATPLTLPEVVLEVRQGAGRQVTYTLKTIDFLIGTVPGCDLRVPGTDLPALLCLLARYPGGVSLRKMAPLQVLLLNGATATSTDLADGDRLTIGTVDIALRIKEVQLPAAASAAPAVPPAVEVSAGADERPADDDGQALHEKQRQVRDELARKLKELEPRAQELDAGQRALETKIREYQADVVRLHRQQGQLEEREETVQKKSQELEERWTALQRESGELEGQLAQLDEWRTKLAEEAERLAAQKRQQDEMAAQMTQRGSSLEGQQATLASLRSRLERQREQVRQEEQQLQEQRAGHEAQAAEWSQKWQELQQLRFEIENERQQHAQERTQWAERGAIMEAAVRQLRQAQEQLAQEEQRIGRQAEETDAKFKQCGEQEGILDGRLAQLAEAQQRLEVERQALRERTLAVVQGEQAREALQEQLRRRAEELASQQKTLADQLQDYQDRFAALEEHRLALDRQEREWRQQLEMQRLEVETRADALARQQGELAGAEEKVRGQAEQLTPLRQALAAERLQFQEEQQRALERQAQARADFEALQRDAQELLRQVPDLELRAGTALDRLGHARGQLRNHLGEIHQYVRGCQDELDQWRTRLRTDLEKLQETEQALRRKQDEHRLAMVGFRQQLIDWQGQIAEMKRVLSRDGTRLERRQADVAEQVRAIDATSQRLARQAEDLQEQQREVAGRRQEIDHHLGDMREWYRHKLRDLAGIALVPTAEEPTILTAAFPPPPSASDADDEGPGIVPTQRGILTLGAPEQGDQRLGDVLRELQLVDADALTALLAEARRQRRSLRQVLLTSGVITLYQLALIEAGNVAALMLGPVRVIDRVRSTPHEALYRVFDPRRGGEAVLRHLSEQEMLDAVRPDEYRQRFKQAILAEPHVAATLEVLDIQERPAVLQEWLAGLPATDWPPLAAAPGVCYRLLTQAALGLAAAHRAGLVHGHLSDAVLLLTADGMLKVCGLGEPPWLRGPTEVEADHRADLKALGRVVSSWCTPSGVRRGAKAKPLPEPLVAVLYRLAADGESAYRDMGEVLEDLERAGHEIPTNAEAWDRLLKYVREHGTPEAMLRQSA
jgi:hypothetical protein